MEQLYVAALSFLWIPILARFRVKMHVALAASVLTLAVFAGVGAGGVLAAFTEAVTLPANLNLLATVLMVCVVGGLMDHYRINDRLVRNLQGLIRSPRKILMLVPMLFGVLIMPGGAIMSAPFVGRLGDALGIKPSRRAAVNLVFRHMAMFLLPFSTSMLTVAATAPHISVARIALLNIVFVVIWLGCGMFFFLRGVRGELGQRSNVGANLGGLLLNSSPVWLCVVLNGLFRLPFWACLLGSVGIVAVIGGRDKFFRVMLRAVNYRLLITIALSFVVKGMIERMQSLQALLKAGILESDSILLLFCFVAAASFFFGVITGLHVTSLSVVLPILFGIPMLEGRLYTMIYFSFTMGFLGYFFSPLHMCQLLTLQKLDVPPGELYREYRLFAVVVTALVCASAWVMWTVL